MKRYIPTIKDFTGITAFLNGEPDLHSIDKRIYDSFVKNGMEVAILDDLFEHPEKLRDIHMFDNLVLFTTGLRQEKTEPLVELFKTLDYVPNNVIFITDETALQFRYLAAELKELGTKFWFVDSFDGKTLFPIDWI